MHEMLQDTTEIARLLMQINSIAIAGQAVLGELPHATNRTQAEAQCLHATALLSAIRTVADRGRMTIDGITQRAVKELECIKSL